MIELTTYEEGRDGLRNRDLRQALYEAGHRLMTGVIVNLHGQDHVARRRLENRLFRRETFALYERERIPEIIDSVLASPIEVGRGELADLARRTMMRLSVDVAGIDLDDGSFDRFYGLMNRLARASTVAHAVGDKQAILDDGDEALAAFDREFYQVSLARRLDLVERVARGQLDQASLPRDVLTTLLVNQDRLDLPDVTVLREIAYYPWVGSHSTSAQLVHAMHHIFQWIGDRPEDRERLEVDDRWRQRFVHESMRLHPASPVALRTATGDVELRSGRQIPANEDVTINVQAANRDPAVFGPNPEEFDPDRTLVEGVAPWGLSFGTGTHACLGQELAGGVEPESAETALDHHLLGAVALMAGRMLNAGARPDPRDPATQDSETTRSMWGRYPVLFGSSAEVDSKGNGATA